MHTERAYWLAWQQVEGFGPHRLRALSEHFGSLEAAWQAPRAQLLETGMIGPVLIERIEGHRQQTNVPEQAATWEETYGACWTPADREYPQLLQEIPDTPPVLYYQGPKPVWQPAVALVGTRKPSTYGLRWAKKLGYELTRAGFLVVSGLATGIDGAAHQGALEAGGATVAVLGCGVELCYPSHHRGLYAQIRERGVILSEYPRLTPPNSAFFPRRNRIISGLTQATIVIEAGVRSGALISAQLALDYGREVFALPGELDNPQAAGALHLISQGATPVLGIEDLIQRLGPPQAVQLPLPVPADLTPLEEHVLGQLTPEPQIIEYLIQNTALGTGDITAVLMLLELKGLAVQLPGLRYRRA